MPSFCDLIAIADPWKREQQLSILRALFMGIQWMPPTDEDGGGVSIDPSMLTQKERDEIIKLMSQKPKGKQAIVSKG